ncbi:MULTISPECIES: transposase [unclassified Cryobacterium]|uniref:transposase n=1 Tax=unclassified Cryobacterium TaxID=2649013 RepID=UPI000CE4175E|nr:MULTISPECIES: transposase [unclassified Cryobacterium]
MTPRITTETQFAALAGVTPIPASSRKSSRHRLSREKDRAAHASIHRIVLVRIPRTNAPETTSPNARSTATVTAAPVS